MLKVSQCFHALALIVPGVLLRSPLHFQVNSFFPHVNLRLQEVNETLAERIRRVALHRSNAIVNAEDILKGWEQVNLRYLFFHNV